MLRGQLGVTTPPALSSSPDSPAEPISIHGAGGSASRENGAATEAREGTPSESLGQKDS